VYIPEGLALAEIFSATSSVSVQMKTGI